MTAAAPALARARLPADDGAEPERKPTGAPRIVRVLALAAQYGVFAAMVVMLAYKFLRWLGVFP